LKAVKTEELWTWEIKPESSWLNWNLPQLWAYRHLLLRMVRRDFLVHHQQTLLGPLWIVFQPIIVLLTYILIFEKAVGLSTDGVEPTLFYFSGIILWNLFSECFTGTSFTFIQNGQLFSKVYFPRLIVPCSMVVLNYFRFLIQFVLFFILLLIYDYQLIIHHPLRWIAAMVVGSVTVAGIGLGMGLIFSILTAKYRDLVNIIHLIIRLLMFASPVIYPLSIVSPDLQQIITLNPLTAVFEFFRYGFLGHGTFSFFGVCYSVVAMTLMVVAGSMLFNKFSNKLQDVI
jgi:lipopolysaccharide transport system permease protein